VSYPKRNGTPAPYSDVRRKRSRCGVITLYSTGKSADAARTMPGRSASLYGYRYGFNDD